jgi:hypothetical protein
MIAHQLSAGSSFGPPSEAIPLIQVQQQCGNGYDLDIHVAAIPTE